MCVSVCVCVCLCLSVCLYLCVTVCSAYICVELRTVVFTVYYVYADMLPYCYSHPQAIENIGNLQMGKWQQLMVPIKGMVDVLKVVREVSEIKRGSWARIK